MLRKKKKMSAVEEAKLEMTPMIDCVFLLLIFFMCSMEFKKSEGLIKAFLPKNRGTGNGTPEIDLGEVRIKLLWYDPDTLRPTENRDKGVVILKVGNKVYPDVDGMPDYESLYRDLIQFRDSYHGGSKDGLPCIIDGRKQVPFEYVVHCLNTCVKARIQDVTFAAPEKAFD